MVAKPSKRPISSETPPKSSPASIASVKQVNGHIEIVHDGDVVLDVAHESAGVKQAHRFRVSSSTLKLNSRYFAGLLSGRFGESERIQQSHALLKEQYKAFHEVPPEELPVIQIEDIGRISAVKSIEALYTDFLLVLHGKDLQGTPPVANLANLAIVADRFDALEAIRSYVQKMRLVKSIDAKTTGKVDSALSEEKVRQRLLVGVFFDYAPWLEKYSARLIVKGWVGQEASESAALWWDLPARLEEELAFRRECILDTLQSLQAYFVGLYTSRERQCRLGYDSSAQCDSFQLGEMMRFLTRIGTIHFRGTILDSAELPEPFEGDINVLIDTLRQVPEYQIDRNHTHCGIRTRLVPLLNSISENLHVVGVCRACWTDDRTAYVWMDSKRPPVWKQESFRARNHGHKELHANVRAMFMATERDWGA